MTKRFKVILSIIFILALLVGAHYTYLNNEIEKKIINNIIKKK